MCRGIHGNRGGRGRVDGWGGDHSGGGGKNGKYRVVLCARV